MKRKEVYLRLQGVRHDLIQLYASEFPNYTPYEAMRMYKDMEMLLNQVEMRLKKLEKYMKGDDITK